MAGSRINAQLRARLKAQGVHVTTRGKIRNAKRLGVGRPRAQPIPGPDEKIPLEVIVTVLRRSLVREHLSAWARAMGMTPVYAYSVTCNGVRPSLAVQHRCSRILWKVIRGELWMIRRHKGGMGHARCDFYPASEARAILAQATAVERSTLYGTLGYGRQA